MVSKHRKLLLIGLALTLAVVLLAGSAVHPVTVRSDVQPQTYCRCYWNAALRMWCYNCCDIYGCYDLYCRASGC